MVDLGGIAVLDRGATDAVVHSTLDTLISSGGGLLCSVSTVWSVESSLELEQEVDSCCFVVWYITERSSLL